MLVDEANAEGPFAPHRGTPRYTIRYLRLMMFVLQRYGGEPTRLFQDAGFDATRMFEVEETMSTAEFLELWRGVKRVVGDDVHLGLTMAAAVDTALVNGFQHLAADYLPVFALLASEDLAAGLDRFARCYRVEELGATISFVREPKTATMAYHLPDLPLLPREMVEYLPALLCQLIRVAVNTEVTGIEVGLPFPTPRDFSPYRRVFGGRVRFATDRAYVRVPTTALALPLRTHQPGVLPAIDRRIARLRARGEEVRIQPPPRTVTDNVRECVLANLGEPTLRVDEIAHQLAMSRRTLSRRLADEGTTFQKVLDEVRGDRVRHLLSRTDDTLEEIATAVGFSDSTAMSRAFRRWYGESPGSWRRSH